MYMNYLRILTLCFEKKMFPYTCIVFAFFRKGLKCEHKLGTKFSQTFCTNF